jgi:hypothetical protein
MSKPPAPNESRFCSERGREVRDFRALRGSAARREEMRAGANRVLCPAVGWRLRRARLIGCES